MFFSCAPGPSGLRRIQWTLPWLLRRVVVSALWLVHGTKFSKRSAVLRFKRDTVYTLQSFASAYGPSCLPRTLILWVNSGLCESSPNAVRRRPCQCAGTDAAGGGFVTFPSQSCSSIAWFSFARPPSVSSVEGTSSNMRTMAGALKKTGFPHKSRHAPHLGW